MTPDAASAWVSARLGLRAGPAARLSGGLLNHVFRVPTGAGSVIVKQAPPFVASAPDIPLDPSRSGFEAAALRWVGARPGAGVRVPRVLDSVDGLLILEDLGEAPGLGVWLDRGGGPVVARLGRWLRGLHDDRTAPLLRNRPVQETRLAVQYAGIGATLARFGVPDAADLGAVARRFGERLLEPGDVFVMGDLWPPSVLVLPGAALAVIDWELATTGRRAQDVGHLLAHLWMGAQRRGWRPALGDEFGMAYGPVARRDGVEIAIHRACEVLVRAAGPFRDGGPYDGLQDDDPDVRAAVEAAAGWLRTSG